ncbi:MAG TPA: class I SAM-dependent methyltransferase [Candidatus Limnocylindrales bacterium]
MDDTPPADLPEHVRRNREAWDEWSPEWVEKGRRNWSEEPSWGIFGIPETELHLLPDDLAGLDTIELGCGTGYVSAWLARLGARPVGIDNSSRQLATARLLQGEFGIDFPLIHGNAETVPLPDASFDLAISEYGAVLWADPERWIPEAARLLRPGGRLITLTNSVLAVLAMPDLESDGPATDRLLRPQRDLGRLEWPDGDRSVEFHPSHGDQLRLLRASGFDVEDLIEIYAPEGATTSYEWMSPEWARQWPVEDAWKARKRT